MGQCFSKSREPKEAVITADFNPVELPAAVPQSVEHKVKHESAGLVTEESADEDDGYAGACGPLCEIARRQHLLDLNVLYTEPERRFDDITKLCAMVFKVPIALVSLVDQQVQWFKSMQGLTVDNTPRNTSFCAWTLLPAYPEALVVQDAQKDARFKDNPLVVGPPYIRFYAGCPLVCSNGLRLGSLCIIDKEPRTFDAESCNLLANMAEMVIREIEKEKALEEHRLRAAQPQRQHDTQLLRTLDAFGEAIMLVDTSGDPWSIVFANEAWESLTGRQRAAPGSSISFWDIYQLPAANSAARQAADYEDAIAKQQNFELLVTFTENDSTTGADGDVRMMCATATFRCAANTGLDQHMPLIGIPNFLPSISDSSKSFYFVSVNKVEPQVSMSYSNSTDISISKDGDITGSLLQQQAPVKKKSVRQPLFNIMSSSEPFSDVKLGPLLGKGAFGRVFRGSWNGKLVAVKVIEYSEDQLDDGGDLLESIVSQQLQHPNVVRMFKHATRPSKVAYDEDGFADGSTSGSDDLLPSRRHKARRLETWLVLEFCNRGCVTDAVSKGWFRQQGSRYEPNLKAILPTAREIASALSYLHSKNILHGDLTGGNVLLTVTAEGNRGWMAKVSDFGLSRLITNEAPVIQTTTYGTVTHMPPELLCEGKMSKAVDVWSFGVVLWEMFVGRPPYAGLSHSQVLHTVGNGKGLSLPTNAPAGFGELLGACLARDPGDRPTFDAIVETITALESSMA